MNNEFLGLGQGAFKFRIRITGHNLFLSFMLWSYMMLMNAAKGHFFSDEGILGVVGSITDMGVRYFTGIPFLIIDFMPIIASALLIILHFMGKPVKKIFYALFVLLLVSHLAYIPLEVIGFQRSAEFILAGFLLAVLFVYFIFVNEEKAKLKKSIIQYDLNLIIEKYNMTMSILLIVVILLVIVTPFIGLSNEAGVINDVIESSGSINDKMNSVSSAFTSTIDDGLGYLNLYAFLFKLPFLIVAIHTVFRNFKNKSKAFTLPKKLIVIGMLTFIGLPFMFERLKFGEMLSVNGIIKMIGYMLFAWVLFEMVFVNEIDKSLKSLSKQGIDKIGLFADVVKNSKFSSQSILAIFQKVPFIGKKIKGDFIKKSKGSKSSTVQPINLESSLGQDEALLKTEYIVLEKGYGLCVESPMLEILGARLSLINDKKQLTAYLNIKNVDSETLTAIVVDLKINDVLGNELEQFEGVQILDLNLTEGASSGWINIPSISNCINARQIVLVVKNCVYSDERILNFSQANVLEFSKVITPVIAETHSEDVQVEGIQFDKAIIKESGLVTKVISKMGNTLLKYKPVVIKHIDKSVAFIKRTITKLLEWVKVNPKRFRQFVAGFVTIVSVIMILGWSTSRPLDEDKAIELYYKHVKSNNSETVDSDLDFISDDYYELEIEWIEEFSEYEVYRRDEVKFKRNILGNWAIEKTNELKNKVTPLYGADASKNSAEISQYLKEKHKDIVGEIQINYPNIDDFYGTFDSVDLIYTLNSDLGEYSGVLKVEYTFVEYKWQIENVVFSQDSERFEPSSDLVRRIESLEFLNMNDFKFWKFNGEQIDPSLLELTKSGDVEYNWERKELSIPLVIAIEKSGTTIQVEKVIDFVFVENAFRVAERDVAIELILAPLHQVGKVNLTEYKEGYDFIVADTFQAENGTHEVVIALKGNLAPQTFDINGNLNSDTRQMGEITIFDESGYIAHQNPKFMLTPLHSYYDNYTEMDLLYNDYEMGINVFVSREIFKYEINDSDYLCIKEFIESGDVTTFNMVMYSIGENYQLIEKFRYDGYQVDEGGTVTESIAKINGNIGQYDELLDYVLRISPATSSFHVTIESGPDFNGQTKLEVLQYGK